MPKKQRLNFPDPLTLRFARFNGTPSSPVVSYLLTKTMITAVASVQAISVESQGENDLQEGRAIQFAMLASEPLNRAEISVESEFQPFSEVIATS